MVKLHSMRVVRHGREGEAEKVQVGPATLYRAYEAAAEDGKELASHIRGAWVEVSTVEGTKRDWQRAKQ